MDTVWGLLMSSSDSFTNNVNNNIQFCGKIGEKIGGKNWENMW